MKRFMLFPISGKAISDPPTFRTLQREIDRVSDHYRTSAVDKTGLDERREGRKPW